MALFWHCVREAIAAGITTIITFQAFATQRKFSLSIGDTLTCGTFRNPLSAGRAGRNEKVISTVIAMHAS